MNILVFVKQVPDTETRIQLKDGVVDTSGVKWIANPYDEFAIEEALRIKERLGQGKVTVLSLGPDRVKDAIKYALSLGADEGVHVKGDGLALADPLAVATVLAAAARKLGFDLILTGKQGVDHDWSQAGIILAELLDLPHVSVVVHLELDAATKQGTKALLPGKRERLGRLRPRRRLDHPRRIGPAQHRLRPCRSCGG